MFLKTQIEKMTSCESFIFNFSALDKLLQISNSTAMLLTKIFRFST